MTTVLFLVISLLSSVAGAVCGIGGGMIIKPALDLFRLADVTTISFLSGCTVLAMTLYSVGRSLLSKDNSVDLKTGTPLAIGGVLGGIAGSSIFDYIKGLLRNTDSVGMVQSIILASISVGVIIFRIKKERIHTKNVKNAALCLLIGVILGIVSSFLGIGGGPLNLVVLFFFFSMKTKVAAQNSLYIILFSQISNLLTTVLTNRIPLFDPFSLVLMVCGGLAGGIFGRSINKRISEKGADGLFTCIMAVIVALSLLNTFRFAYQAAS